MTPPDDRSNAPRSNEAPAAGPGFAGAVLLVLVALAAVVGLVVVGCGTHGATELATAGPPAAPVPSAAPTGPSAATRLVSDAGRFAVVRPPRGFQPQGTPLFRQTIGGATMVTQAFTAAADPSDVRYTGPRFSITATIAQSGTDQPAHLDDMRRTFGATDVAGLTGGRHPITYAQFNGTPVLEWIESPTVSVTVSGIGGTTLTQLLDAANGMVAQ